MKKNTAIILIGQFFWKLSSQRAEKDATKQKVVSFQEVSQKRKMVIKIKSHSSPENRISLSRLQKFSL